MKFKTREVQQVFDYLNSITGLVSGTRPLLKFEEDRLSLWLDVSYLNILTHSLSEEPDKFKYDSFACQGVGHYGGSPEKLLLRIILLLADKLRSTQQDINLLNRDYKLTRK